MGVALIIAAPRPFQLHWGVDGWISVNETASTDTGLTMHIVELSARLLKAAGTIDFTFRWLDDNQWEGQDFKIAQRAVSSD